MSTAGKNGQKWKMNKRERTKQVQISNYNCHYKS
jgi:hypothetical protein